MLSMRGVRTRVSLALAALILAAVPAHAGEIRVPAGGNLQAALDAAVSGDTILLQAGATYSGNFTLKPRPMTAPLVIRTEQPAGVTFPARGSWPLPADAVHYAKIVSPNTMPAFHVRPGMHFVTFEHVEFRATHNQYAVLELGSVGSEQTSLQLAPREIVLDRIFMNLPDNVAVRRGVALNSAKTRIIDCYIAGVKYAGEDSQAIAGWNGPGPFDIEHNYLVGAGENFMLGGSDPSIPYLVPTGVRFVRNYLTKPLSWKGSSWTVKNLFELKNAQDVLIEGNIFEHNWAAAQTGLAILFTPRNQYGSNPATVVQRVVFRNNIVRHVSGVFNILGRDDEKFSQETNDILIENNLFYDVDWTQFGGSGRLLQILGGRDIRLRNNTTVDQDGQIVLADVAPSYGFVLENNLLNYGNYGIHGSGTSPGNQTIAKYLPGSTILGNVIPTAPSSSYPAGNSYPSSWSVVQLQSDYTLAAASPYKNAGTDGRDPGVDMARLQAAMNGQTGTVTPPPPPPPPPTAPYGGTPAVVPGLIEAEHFDEGVNGAAYYDTTPGNHTGVFRATDVDLETTTDAGGGYNVAKIAHGEWLQYTVDVQHSGTYTLELRVATIYSDTTIRLDVDGVAATGSIALPNTGGWQTWATATATVQLQAGQRRLRVAFPAGRQNLNWIRLSTQAGPAPPAVAITSPTHGLTITGTNVALAAAASDSDGTVTRVVYYANGSAIATVTSAPWSAAWSNVAPGTYRLTAVATDSSNLSTTSAPVDITVQAVPVPPTVAITSPTQGTTVTGTSVALAATASDSDGTVTRVVYYANGITVATVTSAPWSATWSSVAAGTYRLTAVATDSSNLSTTSAPVDISVEAATLAPNAPPVVAVTSPANGATFGANASITLSASASDPDGRVVRVTYFANGTQVGSSAAGGSWTVTWSKVKAGSYTLTAVAIDDKGATTTSAPVSILVGRSAIVAAGLK
jgi:hypothetical protein